MALVKRKYTKRPTQSTKNGKDQSDPWNHEEEITLCEAWVDVFESSVEGNDRISNGFWMQVTAYLANEMKEAKRS